MQRFLILMLISLVSCHEDKIDPLVVKLGDTTWTVEKLEVVNNDNEVQTLFPDPEADSEVIMNFKRGGGLTLFSNIDAKGCGQWNAGGSVLEFVISYGQVVPELCSVSNSIGLHRANCEVSFESDEVLVLTGLGGALTHFNYHEEWANIITQVENGDVSIKTYYNLIDNEEQPDQECCARFSWF